MTVKLTEFLLARIAEDEADAKAGWHRYFPADLGDTEAHANAARCNRILGDALAKRQIVQRLSVPDPHEAGEACEDCDVLYCLALPYASHPDYRQTWGCARSPECAHENLIDVKVAEVVLRTYCQDCGLDI